MFVDCIARCGFVCFFRPVALVLIQTPELSEYTVFHYFCLHMVILSDKLRVHVKYLH